MSRFLLTTPDLIRAAGADLDAREEATVARTRFARDVRADGHKVIMVAQDGADGLEVRAVTLLKFNGDLPEGFKAVGADADRGGVYALPDPSTAKGLAVATDMEQLPNFVNQLPRALGFSPEIVDGRLSTGVRGVEQIGRDIVVDLRQEPAAILSHALAPIDETQYADLRTRAARVQHTLRESAPNPLKTGR